MLSVEDEVAEESIARQALPVPDNMAGQKDISEEFVVIDEDEVDFDYISRPIIQVPKITKVHASGMEWNFVDDATPIEELKTHFYKLVDQSMMESQISDNQSLRSSILSTNFQKYYTIVEPANDFEMINFYNNNQHRNQSQDHNIDNDNENRLVNMLINTKFRIEARLISKVQINAKQYATMFGTNYFNQDDF